MTYLAPRWCSAGTQVSDSDAEWNSTHHQIWPRELSEEFDPVVNNWWMGLWYLGAGRYWVKSIIKGVAEPHSSMWTNEWVFNASNNGLMLGGNYFHPASLHFHPASPQKWLWYITFWSIPRFHSSPVEVESQCWSTLLWLKPRKNPP